MNTDIANETQLNVVTNWQVQNVGFQSMTDPLHYGDVGRALMTESNNLNATVQVQEANDY